MLSTFDVPRFNTACTCRDRSNTPLQSLTMANSESILELSEYLGSRLMQESAGESDVDRVRYGYRLCFSRTPTQQELTRLVAYVDRCRAGLGDEARVWSAVGRVLMNLDEFVTRE